MASELLCLVCLRFLLLGLSVTIVESVLDTFAGADSLTCPDDETAYLKFTASFKECAKACQRRKICAGIGYSRRFTLCYLYNSLSSQVETANKENGCIFVLRNSWTNIHVGDCVYTNRFVAFIISKIDFEFTAFFNHTLYATSCLM